MSQFLIACDVGNSRVKYGLFRRDDLPQVPGDPLPPCIVDQVVPRGAFADWRRFQEVCAAEGASSPVGGVIAGTDARGVAAARDDWQSYWDNTPIVIDGPERLPVEVRLPEPARVGIDRLLNAIAANVLRPRDAPAIIIDSGTATTIDVIDRAGAFLGGVILPGFELSARALHQYTALLPLIEIEDIAREVPPPLGQHTRAAMHSGLYWGQLGAVRELIARLSGDESIAQSQPPSVYLTGGGATLLARHLEQARWEPFLSLQGLACAVINPCES